MMYTGTGEEAARKHIHTAKYVRGGVAIRAGVVVLKLRPRGEE